MDNDVVQYNNQFLPVNIDRHTVVEFERYEMNAKLRLEFAMAFGSTDTDEAIEMKKQEYHWATMQAIKARAAWQFRRNR